MTRKSFLVPIENLVPTQFASRYGYNEQRAYEELTEHLDKEGIKNPLIVRPLGDNKYLILDGHHRYWYAVAHGMKELKCIA